MTTEPGWTFDTLNKHWEGLREADQKAISTALGAAEKAVNAALIASEKAILKAEAAADKRAEASNEIRAAMVDQQRNFADKEGTERRLKLLEDANLAGENKTAGVGQLAGIIVIIITAVGIITGIIFAVIRGTGQ